MIIWSGYGFVVFLIVFLNSLIANYVTDFVAKDDTYYSRNLIPLGISFLISALMIKLLWNYFNRMKLKNKGTRVFDSVTIAAGDENKLFFIPFRYWSYIMAVLGIVVILKQLFTKS